MQSESRMFMATIDLFETSVVCLVGLDFDTHKRNFQSLAVGPEDAEAMGKLMDDIERQTKEMLHENVLGLTIFPDSGGCMPFIVLREASYPVLAHELVHVVLGMVRHFGMDKGDDADELKAKLMEYLFKTFYNAMEGKQK